MRLAVIAGFLVVLCVLVLTPAQGDPPREPWAADWEALRARPYPAWFQDAKLGIFIHWGVYSVPAYGGQESYAEWFLRGLQLGDTLRTGFQERVYGPDFTYREYEPLFRAELFDAGEWARLFKRAGAKYIILVSKHHDGYCLWPSTFAPGWNSVEVGPQRDLVGELSAAVRAENLRMGLYYSLTEWTHPLHRWYMDPPETIAPYVEQHMLGQFKELVSAYRPSLLFADGEWFNQASDFHAAELIAWYFNLMGDDAIVNNRWGAGSDIGFLTPEYSSGLDLPDRPWSEVRGLGRSFGLNRNETLDAYMGPGDLVKLLVKAVAHGGGLTINVGPQADGQIPLLQQERLVQLGEWLAVNGEAIYGARPWKRTAEEREVRLDRIDPVLDFNWVRNSPGKPIAEDNFSATWTGWIEAPHTEVYTFEAQVDDDLRLWVDGTLLIDTREQVADGQIELEAGQRTPLRAEFAEERQNAHVQLFWSSNGEPKDLVPASCLFVSDEPGSAHGLQASYRSQAEYLCYTANHGAVYAMFWEWPGPEAVLPIDHPRDDLAIKLLGREGDLEYRRTQDGLQIDLSGIYPNDLPCDHAWTFKIEGLD